MAITHDEFVEKIKKISPNISIIGVYTKSTDRIKVKCNVCGKEWEPQAYSLTQGKGCPHCSAIKGSQTNQGKTGLKSTDFFINQMQSIDSSIKFISKYVNTHTDIKCECLKCGKIWYAKPYSLLQGHGCPKCAKSGTSFMEQFILNSFRRAIGNEKVISRDKRFIGMELDVLIPSLNVAIEPGNWNLHKNNLIRDKEKRERCLNKGITLYTVYDMYPKGLKPPFENNCYIYNCDLNKADHKILVNLVYSLFDLLNIQKEFTKEEILSIEKESYDSAKAMTNEEFVARMKYVNPNIEIIEKYYNSNRRLKVKCKLCGYEWNALPSSLLFGDGCKKCGVIKAHENMKKSQKDFIAELEKINPNVEIIGEYKGRHQPVLARCKICGYIWSPRASSLLRGSSHKNYKTLHANLK